MSNHIVVCMYIIMYDKAQLYKVYYMNKVRNAALKHQYHIILIGLLLIKFIYNDVHMFMSIDYTVIS